MAEDGGCAAEVACLVAQLLGGRFQKILNISNPQFFLSFSN